LPGQADPVYPPGQFSAWNRTSIRAAWLGAAGPGSSAEADAEPGYSALAVSDPSADATVTQTWAVIDEGLLSDGWPPPRTDRDWGSHLGDTGPVRRRTADGQPAGPGRAAGPGRGSGDRRGAGAAQSLQPGITAPGPAQPPSATTPETTPPGTAAPDPVIPRSSDSRARGPVTEPAPAPPPRPRQASRSPGETEGGRRSRAASSGRAASPGRRTGKRHNVMMAGLLLAPVLVVILVAAGYVYFSAKPAPPAGHPAAASRHTAAVRSSPTPTLGPWKHIESRAQDPVPLTVTQLFPQQFSADGAAGTRTVAAASTNCSREVFGTALSAAVRKADCTQVLRASYLSTDHKLMATVGVLNLSDVAAAEQVGKASGSAEFIKQLPAAHGPTRNLSKGTGIEEAEVKGHYLILIWTEFTNLHAPQGKSQRKTLEAFSAGLITGTANVSLSKRMVTGQP
jgi:hypothetical protein